MVKERDEARLAFEAGVAHGKDPASRIAASGVATTTLKSPWLGQVCPSCGHTFRRGDRVEAGARVTHVGCPNERRAEGDPSAAREAFYMGLAAAFPPPSGLLLVRLSPGHPLLGGEGAASFARPTCVVCGHSLRPFDEVIVCPCQPATPLCRAAVHRDANRGLYCWDEWSKSKLSRHCPVTSRRLT